jgi:hypothetical protein
MEEFFGTSFADVRVHVGPQAASIGALAFTMGSDLYFAPGQYDPHGAHGQRLLAHELTHVVQQRAGRVRNPLGGGVAVVQDPALEAEAERMGTRAGGILSGTVQGMQSAPKVGPAAAAGPLRRVPAQARVVQPLTRSQLARAGQTLPDDVHDIPNFHQMGLESTGGGGRGRFYGHLGPDTVARDVGHGLMNIALLQGNWARINPGSRASKSTGRELVIPTYTDRFGDYNPDTPPKRNADTYARDQGGLRQGHANVQYNWCHLHGHGLGGSDEPDNVVCATTHCNTEQLEIESWLKQAATANPEVKFEIEVEAQLAFGTEHLAENISYRVFADKWMIYSAWLDARRATEPTTRERRRIHWRLDNAFQASRSTLNPIRWARHVTGYGLVGT